jgi:hypothetical protein
MTAIESSLLQALLTLEQAASAPRTGEPRPRIQDLIAEIDRLAETLPPETPAELRHFLQRKSYQKAALYLRGRNEENARGSCGH